MSARPRRFLHDTDGAISVIAAISIMMLLAIAAIVIDTGSLYFDRRSLQSANDAAALAAVQDPANAGAVAASVFAQNGYDTPSLTVTTGVYTADESLSNDDRFAAAGSGINAVRIRASVQQQAYFAALFGLGNLTTVTTQATAARVPTASFGAGTRLAELNGGVLNNLLGSLWGSSLSLQLLDYQALVNTNVDALTFFNQLATDIHVTGSYQQLADATVTANQIVNALVETANTPGATGGDPAGALLALQSLQRQLASAVPAPLSSIIDFSPLQGRTIGSISSDDDTGLKVNMMSLLSADARAAASGQVFDVGTAITIPTTSITAHMAIGSAMAQAADAQVGASIHPAEIRLALNVTLLSVPLGLLGLHPVQIPIYLEAASGLATLTAMPCRTGGTLAEIAASSGATSLQFGTVTDAALKDFSTPVAPASSSIVSLPLLKINISGGTNIDQSGPTTLTFSQAEIDASTVKSVPDGGATPFSALSSNISLTPVILGIALNLGGLNNTIAGIVALLDPPVNNLMTALGLELGVIDVRVFDTNCRTPTLVG